MELLKTSILCLTILSGYVRASSMQQHHKIIYTNPNEVHSPECFCLPKNQQGKHVSEHISSKGEKHERLVIYLYKDQNNSVTLYLPNEEKQRHLPELTLDDGDKLDSINTGNIISLYQIYLNFATSNSAQDSQGADGSSFLTSTEIDFPPFSPEVKDTPPQTVKFKPIYEYVKGDSSNQIHLVQKHPSTTFSHDNNVYNPLEVSEKHASIKNLLLPPTLHLHASAPEIFTLDKQGVINNVQESIMKVEPSSPKQISILSPTKENEIHEFDKDMHITISKIPKTDHNANLISVAKVDKPTQLHLQTEGHELNEKGTSETYNLIIHNEHENKIDLPFNLSFKVVPVNAHPNSEQDNEYVENEKFIYVTDGVNLENSRIVLDSNVAEKESVDISKSPYPSLDLQFLIANLPDHSDKQTIFNLVKDNSGQKIVVVVPSSEVNIQMKFEQWFQKQIENIKRKSYSLLQVLKLEDIKILILKVLQKNGITVSNSGDLIDSKGNVFFINKLQLIPIVLKNLQFSREKNCLRPKEVLYLKAVLINLTLPPKILGIIHLGDTFNEAAKQPCYLDRQKVYLSKENKFKTLKEINDKLRKKYEPVVLKTLKLDSFEPSTKFVPTKSNSLLGTMKGARRMINGIPNHILLSKDKENLDNVTYADYEYKDIGEDYEELGIKIIGGQAATSSGTPLSNKG